MTGLFLLLRQDLSDDAAAGEGGFEGGERAVEGGGARSGDLGAEGRTVDDLGGSGGVAHGHGLRRLLDVEKDVVDVLERPGRGAMRVCLLVALQTDPGQPQQPVVVWLELGSVPVLPDAVSRRELEPVGEIGKTRLLQRELRDTTVGEFLVRQRQCGFVRRHDCSDFRFWILDFGLETSLAQSKSKTQNPKSKI